MGGELSSWGEVDQDLRLLAHDLDVPQKPWEAQFHAALDEFAREHPEAGIPTEAEALAWADAQGRP